LRDLAKLFAILLEIGSRPVTESCAPVNVPSLPVPTLADWSLAGIRGVLLLDILSSASLYTVKESFHRRRALLVRQTMLSR
jgi:hypothetical protein